MVRPLLLKFTPKNIAGQPVNEETMERLTLPLERIVAQKTAIDSTSLPNSVLNREQADRFIDMVVDESVLMSLVRVVRTGRNKGEINKLDLGTIVTEGSSTTSRASTSVPTEKVVTYDCEKYRAAFDLKTDFMEDAIEGESVRDTLLRMFTTRISIDTEMAAIEGDETLTTGDGQTAENNLLGVNDGWQTILVAQVPGAQQINAAGAAPSMKLYYDMKRRIPSRYRAAKPKYVWVMPSGPSDKLALDWSTRDTAGGDSALAKGMTPGPWGIPKVEVPLMPEDLTYGSNGTEGSSIWLTPLKNLIYFVQRDITIEFDRRPRQDVWEITIHFRVDFEVENPELVILANNVDMTGSDYTS